MQAQTRRYSVVGSLKKIESSDNNSHVQPAAAQEVRSVSSNLHSPQQVPSSTVAPQLPTPESTPFRTPKRSAPASEPHTPETTPSRTKRQDQKASPRRDFSGKFASAGRWLRRSSQLLTPLPLLVRPPVVQGESAISPTAPGSLQPAFDVGANLESKSSGAEITHNLSSAQGDCSRSLSMSPRTDRKDAKAVLTVIKQLRDETYRVKKGDKDKYSIQRKLQYRGYKLLRDPELLKEVDGPDSDLLDYIDRYLRFEYLRDPLGNDKQFVIRMPSEFHEIMAWGFGDIIRTWLDDIKRGEHLEATVKKTRDWTMKVASNIEPTGATRIRLQKPGNSMEPDASYKHKICSIPDLLVEVSWSQRGKMLPGRAKRLIEEMDGRVRTVIGLDMNDIYKGGRKATFSVWKAKSELNNSRKEKWTAHTVINNQEFINEKGEPVEGCELSLSLKDFICQHTQHNWGKKGENYIFEDVPVRIPARTLYEKYESALNAHAMVNAADGMKKIGQGLDMIAEILEKEDTTEQRKAIDATKYVIKPREDWEKVKSLISEGYLNNGIYEMRQIIDDVEKELVHVSEDMKENESVGDNLDGLKSRLEETRAAVAAEEAEAEDAEETGEVTSQERTTEPTTPRQTRLDSESPSRLRRVWHSVTRSPRT